LGSGAFGHKVLSRGPHADRQSFVQPRADAPPASADWAVDAMQGGGTSLVQQAFMIFLVLLFAAAAVWCVLLGSQRATRTSELVRAVELSAADVIATTLTPRQLFVAWNGVLTLAFDGFPPGLFKIKQSLNQQQQLHLPRESFGSKWPKTTLAALEDTVQPLTLKQLQTLKSICNEHSSELAKHLTNYALEVAQLSVVQYRQRSLEEPWLRSDINFKASGIHWDEEHDHEPAEAERQRVSAVLAEWNDEEKYLKKVNAPGSRISSYRNASPAGSTCVAYWGVDQGAHNLRQWLRGFRTAVDEALPGYYNWMAENSLHCTVRAL